MTRASRPPGRDADPRAVTLTPGDRTIKTQPAKAEVLGVQGSGSCSQGRCWRCGVPFAWTTPEVLARCTALAQAPDDDNPLHYPDAEVIEGWAGDDQDAVPWLHQRTARRGEPR